VAAVCVNADGAAGRAEAESIDAAIVDYSLGGRNGLWLCRRLKRLRRPPRGIFFSAFADEHLAACCAVAGADAVLNKGALGSELCHAIRAVMRGRRMLPRISPGLAGMLRGRLADDEQLLFGMLLAGMAREEVARTLGIPMHELLSREDALLDEVEPLPGEIAAIERGRRPLDLERVVPRAPFHSTSGA
jgi:DNA-binding NarL/FixJ family response regulator